jgi:hypothetical protein
MLQSVYRFKLKNSGSIQTFVTLLRLVLALGVKISSLEAPDTLRCS